MAEGEMAKRAPDGTFLPGVSGNPKGRPPSKKNQLTNLKQDLEIAIRRNVSATDVQEIVQSMIDLAKEGSVGAAKLILDKTVSNAKDAEHTEEAGGGIRVVVENVTIGRDNSKTIDAEDGEYTEIEDN